jgi:superfamily II DNA helicase RecQ
VATSSFGVGVNISDVKLVIHRDYTYSLRQQIQEGGRCARGKDEIGVHIVLFNGDTGLHNIEDYVFDADAENQDWAQIRRDISAVILYCTLKKCRRQSYLQMAYNVEPRSCTPDELPCDICSQNSASSITPIDTASEAQCIYDVIKKCNDENIPISADFLLKVLIAKKKVYYNYLFSS